MRKLKNLKTQYKGIRFSKTKFYTCCSTCHRDLVDEGLMRPYKHIDEVLPNYHRHIAKLFASIKKDKTSFCTFCGQLTAFEFYPECFFK